MPFTPLHMGPGLLFKALLQGSFSLLIFGWTQILIDIQPLLVLLTGKGALHGITHSYLGALILALIAAPSGKYLLDLALRQGNWHWLSAPGWPVSFGSAILGAASHVLLDSLMHADISPLLPFRSGNGLCRLVSYDNLNLLCFASGLLGLILWMLVARIKNRAG